MYIPVQKRPAGKRLSQKQQSRRSRIGIWLACIVIVVGAAWGIWHAKSEPDTAAARGQSLQHDLQTLWEWSDSQLAGGAESGNWSLRWEATGERGLANQLVELLFTDEEGKQLDKLVQNQGRTVSGFSLAYGGQLSVSLLEGDERQEKVLLLFTTKPGGDGAAGPQSANAATSSAPKEERLGKADLQRAEAGLSQMLKREGAALSASMKVQGQAARDNAVDELIKQANGKQIDSYEEGGTVSATLYSGQIRSLVDLGRGQLANVQIAAHKQTGNGNTALTIGIPIITGDYSLPQADQR
jgi:hypothetical protein